MTRLGQRGGGCVEGIVDLARGHERSAGVSRLRVQVDHRRGVLVRGEGERAVPVEGKLGDDRGVEGGR